jgi:drug/metabolite transporter (DMT)-like permease
MMVLGFDAIRYPTRGKALFAGILAGLSAGALWGLVFVAPRMVSGLSPVDFTAGRFLSYGALSAVMMLLLRRAATPTVGQAMAATGLSVLGFTGYYLLLVYAIRDAGTEVPSLIIGTIPIWMMLLGIPMGLRWVTLIPGLILTTLGLALMVYASSGADASAMAAAASQGNFWRGVAFSVASMACWTAFGLLNAAWLKKHPDVGASTWANWLGVATGVGAFFLWWTVGTDLKTLKVLDGIDKIAIICIATGIGSAWLATYLWNIASQRLSASLCGQLIVSETIFALVYSFTWDGHWPGMLQLLACMLFIAGILASIRAHR